MRTVEDAFLLTAAQWGKDSRDPAHFRGAAPCLPSSTEVGGLHGLTLSAPPSLASAEVNAHGTEAIYALRRAGPDATSEVPDMPEPATLLGIISAAGAMVEYGSPLQASEEQLADHTRRSLGRGARLTGADVALAYADIDKVVRTMDGLFESHGALVLPTTATTAPKSLMRVPQRAGGSVSPWLISTLHVSLASLIQAPAIAIPTGFDREGLPPSVQIVARPGDEVTLLRCAAVVEQALSQSGRPPIVLGPSRAETAVSMWA